VKEMEVWCGYTYDFPTGDKGDTICESTLEDLVVPDIDYVAPPGVMDLSDEDKDMLESVKFKVITLPLIILLLLFSCCCVGGVFSLMKGRKTAAPPDAKEVIKEVNDIEEIRSCEDAHAVGEGLADGRGSAAASRCEDCPASIVSEVVEVDDGIQEPSELTAPSHMLQHTTTSPSFGDLCSSAAVETIPHADTSSRALFGRRILSLGEDIAPCQPAGIRGFNDNASRRRLSIDQALELGRVDRCRPVIVPL